MILRAFYFCLSIGIFSCNNNPKQEVKEIANEIKSKDTSNRENYIFNDDNGIVLYHQLSKLLPPGYKILDTANGDLNLDGIEDMLIILKSSNEEENSGENRPLLIVLGDEKSNFKIVYRNDNVIYCSGCGGALGDPYEGLVIKNGYFSAEFFGGSRGRWSRTITFKYDKSKNNWYLHKDGYSTFDSLDESENPEVEEEVLTKKDFGEVLFKNFNYNDNF